MKNLNYLKLTHHQAWNIRAGSEEEHTKIQEITSKVTINKAKMADKAMNAMTQYISS
ncbi:MAG: hypothetical protein WBB45_16005 [Cyclobacteriaceae bacterium]